MIIALVSGASVIFPHVLNPNSQFDVVPTINNALPLVGMILVAILAVMLLIGIFSKKLDLSKSPIGGLFVIIAIVAVVYIFLAASGAISAPHYFGRWLQNSALVNTVIALLVFMIVIGFITGDDKKKDKDNDGFLNQFKKLLND